MVARIPQRLKSMFFEKISSGISPKGTRSEEIKKKPFDFGHLNTLWFVELLP